MRVKGGRGGVAHLGRLDIHIGTSSSRVGHTPLHSNALLRKDEGEGVGGVAHLGRLDIHFGTMGPSVYI